VTWRLPTSIDIDRYGLVNVGLTPAPIDVNLLAEVDSEEYREYDIDELFRCHFVYLVVLLLVY